MAGRLLPLFLLLLLLPSSAPARASTPRQAAGEDSQRCPRLEDGLPLVLRRTCRISLEGYPAEEVLARAKRFNCGKGQGSITDEIWKWYWVVT